MILTEVSNIGIEPMYSWIEPINFGRIMPEWPRKERGIIHFPQVKDGMRIDLPVDMPTIDFPESGQGFKTEVPAEFPLTFDFPEIETKKGDIFEITLPLHLDRAGVSIKTADIKDDAHGEESHRHHYLNIMG